jgi:general secretion pathway protein B
MSFILDALRKSERERQQSAVPGISDVPAVVQSSRIPAWAVAVIVILSAGVLFFGWAWWNGGGDQNVAVVRPSGVLPQSGTVSPAPPSDAVRDLAREPSADAIAGAPAAQPSVPATVRAAPPPESPAMIIGAPTMLELIAEGVVLPQLTLELHVFSSTPADRFVRVNSASYREGEVLSDGPSVAQITEEGVILDYRGQLFLLSAE